MGGSSFSEVSMLKSLRMLRLLRLLRLLVAFHELYMLIGGLTRCMKVLFWAALLIFVVQNVWSIISVEYLKPVIAEMVRNDSDIFGTCSWCAAAFDDVYLANLSIFQIITG